MQRKHTKSETNIWRLYKKIIYNHKHHHITLNTRKKRVRDLDEAGVCLQKIANFCYLEFQLTVKILLKSLHYNY